MALKIQMELNANLFLRNPEETKLVRHIVEYGIILMEEVGFERFTFKKLAERIQSTEASIYRYFENKHNFLVYLVSWYWEWVRFYIDLQTTNLTHPAARLDKVMWVIVESAKQNPLIEHINERLLHNIVIAEAAKVYHTKDVDKENQDGFYLTYKALCRKISDIIIAVQPDFPYPRALASTLLEMAGNQIYYARHLPSLTDLRLSETEEDLSAVYQMLAFFVRNLLQYAPAEQT